MKDRYEMSDRLEGNCRYGEKRWEHSPNEGITSVTTYAEKKGDGRKGREGERHKVK